MDENRKLPQLHTIAYPDKYFPKLQEDGASAFSGKSEKEKPYRQPFVVARPK